MPTLSLARHLTCQTPSHRTRDHSYKRQLRFGFKHMDELTTDIQSSHPQAAGPALQRQSNVHPDGNIDAMIPVSFPLILLLVCFVSIQNKETV